MRLLSKTPQFDFLGRRKIATAISIALLIASIVAIAVRGLNFGIDFTGGVLVEVGYSQPANLPEIRQTLADAGFEGAIVQNFGNAQDVLVRLPPVEVGGDGGAVRDQVQAALRERDPEVELRRVEFVGPQVGEELTEQGSLAMLFALIMIGLYVVVRFQWRYALGSIAALVHDVLISVGFFAVTGLTFDLSVLAALLATIGYSLNDTIVVFDRIRENFRGMRKGTPQEIMNLSVNQMLARTLITGVTTLLVLTALLFLGGETVGGFAIALIVGLIVGTYSSIYVASAVALALGASREDFLIPKDKDPVDELP